MHVFIFSNGLFSLIQCLMLQFFSSFNLKCNASAKLHILGVSVLLPTNLNSR